MGSPGFEPGSSALEAPIIAGLYYDPLLLAFLTAGINSLLSCMMGGGGWQPPENGLLFTTRKIYILVITAQ